MNEQEPLKPLPHPVYFVCKNTEVWKDVMNSDIPPSAEELYERLIDAEDIRCVQTYVELKRRGVDVYLVPHYIVRRLSCSSRSRTSVSVPLEIGTGLHRDSQSE